MAKYKFFKQKEEVNEIIQAEFDPIKDWCQDPKGYFLIRINKRKKQIEVGFANNNHVIVKEIIGKNGTEIYQTIIKRKLVKRLEHAAYLGKELFRAEMCLKEGRKFVQDCPYIK